jgi:transcriptional repressor NrdR
VLRPLRALDEVGYLRFASVYRAFSALSDFEAEIALLRAGVAVPEPVSPADEHAVLARH